ncbi:MAG TPA: hypothetical protein VHB68_09265 [Steroidobacteraceae bacterium]|nr:hypothetical protein [Steroidobacteraceae bacterium]
MFKTLLASALAISMAVPTVGAFAATPADCALNQVAAAQPLRERVQLGGRLFRDRLAGATLFIPAEKGVTTDYLKRIADAHQAQMAGGAAMKDCPFGVAGSTIEVSSNNSGYLLIAIQSKDDGAAKEILRRAELAVK